MSARLDPPGSWARHAGRVMRVIWGGPFGTGVAAPTPARTAVLAGVGLLGVAAIVGGRQEAPFDWGADIAEIRARTPQKRHLGSALVSFQARTLS